MSLSIRRDDTVKVVVGKERGKMGKILKIFPDSQRALVEKLNMVKRHARATKANPQGGIVEKEASIALSNLMIYCDKCSKQTRIGARVEKDGKKLRVCRRCGQVLDKT